MISLLKPTARLRVLAPGMGLMLLLALFLSACGGAASTAAAPTPTVPINSQICGPGCDPGGESTPLPTATPTPPLLVASPTVIASVNSNQVHPDSSGNLVAMVTVTLTNRGTQFSLTWQVTQHSRSVLVSPANGQLPPKGSIALSVSFS